MLATPDDAVFFKQRLVNSVAQLCFNDEPDLVYMNGVGTFMGTPEGARFFLKAFQPRVGNWVTELWPDGITKDLVLQCDLFGNKHDGSLTKFADDLWRTIPLQMGTADESIAMNARSNTSLDLCIEPFKQHMSKQDVVPMLESHKHRRELSRREVDYKFLSSARHLGGMFSWNGSVVSERRRRI